MLRELLFPKTFLWQTNYNTSTWHVAQIISGKTRKQGRRPYLDLGQTDHWVIQLCSDIQQEQAYFKD